MDGRKLVTTGIVLVVAAFVCLLTAMNIESSKLSILLYHNIVRDGEATSSMSISESKFENDIKTLADKGFTFVLPEDLLKEDFKPNKRMIMISFDDGYRSNYEIAYPILKKYNAKAEISVICQMINEDREMFCTWDMLKEMASSGLVEIGSHTNNCHNPNDGGNYVAGRSNGIQRIEGESDSEFKLRVLDDITLSFNTIKDKIGKEPLVFTYPYGEYDKDADVLVEDLFKISFGTKPGMAKIDKLYKLSRFEIYEDTDVTRYIK